MKFYHGTTKEHWKEIQQEGMLWGRKNKYNSCGNKMNRITWLAKKQEHAGIYDNAGITTTPCVILEVNLPEIKKYNGWQLVTYNPIPILRVKKL